MGGNRYYSNNYLYNVYTEIILRSIFFSFVNRFASVRLASYKDELLADWELALAAGEEPFRITPLQ
ncbi:MAG: hypothetical protein D3923_12810 [Candidatus Electrothrix sp. AR3]|nr:hypothetical protein [Candidatus Electrothrix sp. AR3]